MSEKPTPYLHIVRADPAPYPVPDAAAAADAPADAPSDGAAGSLNEPLQQAIMYAAVSWVALVVERNCHSVDIQPVAARVYEVSVHYADPETGQGASSEGIILRVRLEVEPGLALRSIVEPTRPQ